MSDEEFLVQMLKIFMGIVIGIIVIFMLWHINHNIATLITISLSK